MKKIYQVMYILFAKHLPQSRHLNFAKLIRVFFGKIIMESVGEGVNIEKGAHFNSNVKIGNYSGIGVNCELNGPVILGDYISMGPEVVIYTRNHAFNNKEILIQEQGYEKYKQVIINDDVWIGRRVIILPGVEIGKGAIIGAGSVVTKDVPPYAIFVGNPGKIVKYRGE